MRRIALTLLTFLCLLFLTGSRADAENLVALNTGGNIFEFNQRLFIFDSAAPSVIISTTPVAGLMNPGERLIGIDYRPSDGRLYGISLDVGVNRIYTIDTQTGVATFVAVVSPPISPGSPPGSGVIGMDFDPTTGRLRLVNVNGRNLSVNVETGEAIVEGTVAFAPGDPNAERGRGARVEALAYTNNFAGTASTTLYGIDTDVNRGTLVIFDPLSSGSINTVGGLEINGFITSAHFDISAVTGTAYAALAVLSPDLQTFSTQLYSINLSTGAATSLGQVGTSSMGQFFNLFGLATPTAAPIPEPTTMLLLGTGLAGVGAAAHRRRQRDDRDRA